MSRRSSFREGIVLVAVLVIASALLAACGSGSGSGGTAAANDEDGNAAGVTEIVAARFPNGRDTDEVSVTGAKPIRPCTLVTKRQAKSILGAGVKVAEVPQGPTCLYSGSGRQVSLVIEKVSLKQLRAGARHATRVNVSGRSGWCLTYESTAVVLPVGHGRVLQVSGPCQAGVRFAAFALRRL